MMRARNRIFLIVGAGNVGRGLMCFNSNSVKVVEAQKMEIEKVNDSLKRSSLLIKSFHEKQRHGKGERKRNKTSFRRQAVKNGRG
jgi:hypothetical protein